MHTKDGGYSTVHRRLRVECLYKQVIRRGGTFRRVRVPPFYRPFRFPRRAIWPLPREGLLVCPRRVLIPGCHAPQALTRTAQENGWESQSPAYRLFSAAGSSFHILPMSRAVSTTFSWAAKSERERVSISGGDCALGCVTLPLLALLPASEAADLHCCERVPCGAGGPTPPRSAVLCAVTHVCP